MSLREDADRPSSGIENPAETGSDERAEHAVPAPVPAAAGSVAPSAAPARKRPLRRLVLLALLAAALAGGAYQGWQWWTVGRFFVATDDAYVQADISVLAAKVPGY